MARAVLHRRMPRIFRAVAVHCTFALFAALPGCDTLATLTDQEVAAIIEQRQREVLNYRKDAPILPPQTRDALPGATAYRRAPDPGRVDVPPEFRPAAPESPPDSQPSSQSASQPETQPGALPATRPGEPHIAADALRQMEAASAPASQPPMPDSSPAFTGTTPTTQPTAADVLAPRPGARRAVTFTLVDSLAYALKFRREYQTAKEDLYLVTLALTLERHLWTPIFSHDLRAVYGNFGEDTDFDQAMRFVSELSVAQRLPYGGNFTAGMINTLVRDIRRGITASETGSVELAADIPLLRGAGHVAREQLVQLERDLTYAVRDFERFRRSQLVDVSDQYFELIRAKQEVLDSETSLSRFVEDFDRARALQEAGTGTILDTQRAEQQKLSAENRVEEVREQYRASADQFKILIGMPVDEPLELEDIEDIDALERQIGEGRFPLLQPPAAVHDEERALDAALTRRLDLLNRRGQIDDARRGVSIARNGLLPDLGWNSTLSLPSDSTHYNSERLSFDRAVWRSEMVLSLPLERTAERNQFRTALIDVRRAERNHQQLIEQIRAEVRAAVHRIRLEDRSLQIQMRNLEVAELRREYARIQFYDGDIGNRDLIEAEDEWTNARNRLNLAKTSRWSALLRFRIATETLVVDDDGRFEE